MHVNGLAFSRYSITVSFHYHSPKFYLPQDCDTIYKTTKWSMQILHDIYFYTYQFSCSVMSDSLQPHGLKHARPPCPSPTQTYVHWVGDAIQPSDPLLSPSPPSCNLSQRQGLFQWLSSSHQVAKVLEFQLQHQSFQWIFWTDFPLESTASISLQSKGLSRVSSNSTVKKHQFFGTLYSPTIAFFIVQLSHPYMTTGKTIALTRWTFDGKFSIFIKRLCCIVNS